MFFEQPLLNCAECGKLVGKRTSSVRSRSETLVLTVVCTILECLLFLHSFILYVYYYHC